jgi:FAD binding domain/Berberine and berberine like
MARSMPSWESLQDLIAGQVVLPGSPAYQKLSKPFNARFHDVRPQAVVLCATPQDVTETISFARRHGMECAPRSGGHCFAGRSVTRGLVIDVTPMGSVSVSGGVATVDAGARLGAVYESLQQQGLAIPAGTCRQPLPGETITAPVAHLVRGVDPNFPDSDLEDWAHASSGSNHDRLVRVTARYDPGNLFCFHQSLPTTSRLAP